MEKKNILNNWFRRVWVEEEASAISELFKPEDNPDKAYGLNKEEGLDPEGYVQFHRAILNLIDIEEFKIDRAVENDDVLFSECTMKFKDREHKVALQSITGCVVAKIRNGKIISANNYFDFLQLFSLLDKIPSDSMSQCLQGRELRYREE